MNKWINELQHFKTDSFVMRSLDTVSSFQCECPLGFISMCSIIFLDSETNLNTASKIEKLNLDVEKWSDSWVFGNSASKLLLKSKRQTKRDLKWSVINTFVSPTFISDTSKLHFCTPWRNAFVGLDRISRIRKMNKSNLLVKSDVNVSWGWSRLNFTRNTF